LRNWESKYGPFIYHDVTYCDATSSKAKCKYVITSPILIPNGITLVDDGSQLLVADTLGGAVFRYAVNAKTHDVVFQEKIELGAALDNLRNVPNSRDVLAAGFPDFKTFPAALHHPNDPKYKTEAVGIRITPAKVGSSEKSKIRAVYWDDGTVMSLMTVIATDEQENVTLGGSVFNKGIIYCDHSV